jgi:cupin fold WbuC family metalloprotein
VKGLSVVDASLLDGVSAEARGSQRRRKNRNLHAAESEPCNRLLNAVEPDSYVPPHRHLDPHKEETFAVLRGRFGVVVFDDEGKVSGTALLEAGGERMAATVAHGTWHTLLSLAPGSVFFEAKGGPYAPLLPEERAPWAPAEGAPDAPAYLERLRRLFV